MDKLVQLRHEYNMSQAALAEKCHLSQQAIWKYENHISEPDIETLKRLADIFHTSIDYLVDYKGSSIAGESGEILIEGKPLSSREVDHLLAYRRLSEEAKLHLDFITKKLQDTDDTIQL